MISPLGHLITHAHQRTLVDAGGLVGAHVFPQAVDIHAGGGAIRSRGAHHDARAIDLVHHTRAAGHDGGTRVTGHGGFHTGANQRRIRLDQRDGLALHVGAHQGAVRVVVLQERNQRGGDGDKLFGRDVNGCDILGLHEAEVATVAHGHQFAGEAAVRVLRRIRLRHDEAFLFHRGKVLPAVLHHAIFHEAIRRLDEAVFVDLGEGGERVDQADVRAFRGLDRADTAVMRGMHVTHFEAGALTRETAGAKRGQAALMGVTSDSGLVWSMNCES